MKQGYKKLLLACTVFILFIGVMYVTNIKQYLSLEQVKMQSGLLKRIVEQNYLMALFVYIAVYAGIVALSLPVTGPLCIAAGFMFGFFPGMLYSLFAGMLGALLAFFFFRRMVKQLTYFATMIPIMEKLKKKLDRHGSIYLLVLHLSIVAPFIVINMLAAVLEISYKTFILITVIGMIPAVAIFSFAGTQLTIIRSINDLFSWHIILALVLLVLLLVLPIIFKKKVLFDENT